MFLRNLVYLLLLIISTSCAVDINKQPNVIIVLTDDQGYGDFSCYGNPVLKTPNLDKLHSESVSFSNFHVSQVCTPSRGELMSGLSAMHNKACMVPSGRNLMRRDIETMPKIFKDNGYETGLFGKWHLGDTYPDRPIDKGFDRVVWHKGWGIPSEAEFDNDYYKTRYIDQFKTVQSDMYCTDLWFKKAIEWMGDKVDEGKPFLSYIALNSPHGPYYAKPEDKALYDATAKDSITASFFGMIHNIDVNMKDLDDWMKRKGIKENTILIYMNDNGGTAGVKTYNAGMKGKKGSNYDGGHRGACFFRYPQKIKKSKVVNYPSNITDILPTLMDVLQLHSESSFDGVSLKPFIFGDEVDGDRMFVVQYGGRIKPSKYYSCIVYNNWRLVGENELYDVIKDPGQAHNVIDQYPEVANKIQDYYEKWWAKVAPEIEGIVPVVLDTDHENPTIITSNTWKEVDVDNAWRVSAAYAKGERKGGIWKIDVKKTADYTIQLSRWPFHLNIASDKSGPTRTVGGTLIYQQVDLGFDKSELRKFSNGGVLKPSVALPIVSGVLSINGQEMQNVYKSGEQGIVFNVSLEHGNQDIQAWFQDEYGKALCGAYYMKISKE